MDAALGLTAGRDSARFLSSIFSLFAMLAVGLAVFGVYGVVAHSVTERRREFGVRIALGASARQILHAVLRESVIVALAGVALGLLCTKLSESTGGAVSGGEPYDVILFVAMSAALIGSAFVAAFIPAMRATRVDPTESLRND
jgi:ABC-type antimicrobial peptide transport system permease subunit